MTWVAGVDACRGGWFVVARDLSSGRTLHLLKPTFADVLGMRENPRVIAVDIPIGLLDAAARGGRACDREARRLVGPKRGTSVFSPPVRAALRAASWHEANAANRASSPAGIGLSRQSWGIAPKIAEVDALMSGQVRQTVRECFPELSFTEMAGGPMRASKRTVNGIQDRAEALVHAGFTDPLNVRGGWPASAVSFDDVLDAHACCWTAARIFEGVARRLPPRGAGARPQRPRDGDLVLSLGRGDGSTRSRER